MNFTIKPNFKVVGKTLGSKIKLFQETLLNLSDEEIDKIVKEETINIMIDGENLEVTPEMVDIRIESKEGFNVGMQNNNFVILKTELTKDLILEGIAREIVSKVQNMRKTLNFDIADRIKLYFKADGEILEAFNTFSDYIKDETLAVVYEQKDNDNEVDINGNKVYITIEKN